MGIHAHSDSHDGGTPFPWSGHVQMKQEWEGVREQVRGLEKKGLIIGTIQLFPETPHPRVSLRIHLGKKKMGCLVIGVGEGERAWSHSCIDPLSLMWESYPGGAVSLHVHLSVLSPTSMPSYLKFLGPEGRVMPWRTKFEQARDAW